MRHLSSMPACLEAPGACSACRCQGHRAWPTLEAGAWPEWQWLSTCRQDEGGQRLLHVNFDPALVRVLREVHYFLLLPDLPQQVPAPALKVRTPPRRFLTFWPCFTQRARRDATVTAV